jgi:hypothetical protein
MPISTSFKPKIIYKNKKIYFPREVMDSVLAKFIIGDFIGKWVFCITGDAELDELLILIGFPLTDFPGEACRKFH